MHPHAVSVDGLTLRWLEAGAGLPVVFLHGLPTGPLLWRHVVPRLPGARCLAWELVGYAGSIPEGLHHDLGLAAQADHLLRGLDALGLDRVVLVGHELGGGVVQRVATLWPQRCAGLVLVDSVAYASWPVRPARVLRALRGLVRRVPDTVFGTGMRAFFLHAHDDPEEAADSAGIHLEPYLAHDGAAALARQLAALDARDTRTIAHLLPDVRVPARVVWGTADPYQPLDVGQRLAADLHAPLSRVEGARHFVPEDHPDSVARAVLDVLAEVDVVRPPPPARPGAPA